MLHYKSKFALTKIWSHAAHTFGTNCKILKAIIIHE